jgi:peptidoglycan/xylan/chitin deacetylase (PgdA/CDA1 family)
MNFLTRSLAAVSFLCLLAIASSAQDNQVCFTIDDLPIQRPLQQDAAKQYEITMNILSSLKKYNIPAIGFVNENRLYINNKMDQRRVKLLVQWLENGMELGNHTFSHPDYNKYGFEAFKEEILKGQVITGKMCNQFGRPIRYFRHPYLHRGDSQAKVDSLATYLKSIGLTEAPVTIDNSEWIFAAAYDSVLTTNDTALLHSIGNTYINYMEDKVHFFERQSGKLFGRNIRQILLIHANALNGDYLDDLAEMLVKNHYSFIPLSEALKDKAYQSEDHYYKSNGISWLDRWALTKGYKGDFFAGEPATPMFVKKLARVGYE